MPEVKEDSNAVPSIGYVKMKMLVVTDEDIANCDTKCENCMKVRFEHPDMAGERNDWCVDCNDEERKQNGYVGILNGSLDIGSSEQGQSHRRCP